MQKPNPGTIDRRQATEADIPFLLELRRDTMDRHLDAAGESLSGAAHLDRLLHRFESAQVLMLDGQPIGMIKLLRGAAVWEILQFQLSPHAQGRGTGRRVLMQVIAEADAAGVTLRLCVLKDNPARHLYESLGFRIVGEDAHEFQMQRSCRQASP